MIGFSCKNRGWSCFWQSFLSHFNPDLFSGQFGWRTDENLKTMPRTAAMIFPFENQDTQNNVSAFSYQQHYKTAAGNKPDFIVQGILITFTLILTTYLSQRLWVQGWAPGSQPGRAAWWSKRAQSALRGPGSKSAWKRRKHQSTTSIPCASFCLPMHTVCRSLKGLALKPTQPVVIRFTVLFNIPVQGNLKDYLKRGIR